MKETLTIGCIPGGTANGLIASLLYESGEEFGVKEAAFAVTKGFKTDMDLHLYQGEWQDQRIYSFLSLTWAVLADCDINSECIRCMGQSRFTLWGIYRSLFCLRNHHASISFEGIKINNRNDVIPKVTDYASAGDLGNSETQPDAENQQAASPWEKITIANTNFTHFLLMNTPWSGNNYNFCPLSKIDDGYMDLIVSRRENSGHIALARVLIDEDAGEYWTENGDVRPELGIEYYKIRNLQLRPQQKGVQDEKAAETSAILENSSRDIGLDDNVPELAVEHREDAIYSIDGERFKAQNINVSVLPKALPIYFLHKEEEQE